LTDAAYLLVKCHCLKTNWKWNCTDDCVVVFGDGAFLFYILHIESHYVHF